MAVANQMEVVSIQKRWAYARSIHQPNKPFKAFVKNWTITQAIIYNSFGEQVVRWKFKSWK